MIGMTAGSATCSARDLDLEMIDPASVPLVRLYRHVGCDWDEPDPKYRTSRVDPPDGHKDAFSVLYMANSIGVVAAECRLLTFDTGNNCAWDVDKATPYKVVRYTHAKPAIFLPIDGHRNKPKLGLDGPHMFAAGYAPFQDAALVLYQRFGDVVHGLSWESFTRNQPGRVYALWHKHKATIGLSRTTLPPHGNFVEDADWKALLAEFPHIKAQTSDPS